VTVFAALAAFVQEDEHCGELDSGLEGDYSGELHLWWIFAAPG